MASFDEEGLSCGRSRLERQIKSGGCRTYRVGAAPQLAAPARPAPGDADDSDR